MTPGCWSAGSEGRTAPVRSDWCFVPARVGPMCRPTSWTYAPTYFPPGFSIEVARDMPANEPLLFYLPFAKPALVENTWSSGRRYGAHRVDHRRDGAPAADPGLVTRAATRWSRPARSRSSRRANTCSTCSTPAVPRRSSTCGRNLRCACCRRALRAPLTDSRDHGALVGDATAHATRPVHGRRFVLVRSGGTAWRSIAGPNYSGATQEFMDIGVADADWPFR